LPGSTDAFRFAPSGSSGAVDFGAVEWTAAGDGFAGVEAGGDFSPHEASSPAAMPSVRARVHIEVGVLEGVATAPRLYRSRRAATRWRMPRECVPASARPAEEKYGLEIPDASLNLTPADGSLADLTRLPRILIA
jgi:hypothetical protein